MISQSQIDYFKEVGIWYTGIEAKNSQFHISGLNRFLSKDARYKNNFIQRKFNQHFEGYSYLGQEDSLNQGRDDQVFTYVLSDFVNSTLHPTEFQELIQYQTELIKIISDLEKEILTAIDHSLISLLESSMGHMLSANYYPQSNDTQLRLTAHPDVSLFTVFPFGLDKEFQFEMPDGSWQTLEKTDEIICFSGYLLQCLTGIKALNHKVEKKGFQNERYSFAYFSIPKPNTQFKIENEEVASEKYFSRYLSLFD
jgi:hypothetical protein